MNMAKKQAEKTTCTVCTSAQYARLVIPCPSCNYAACTTCVRRYVIESINDATCMNCGTPFDYTFLHKLGKTWHSQTYKESRKLLLLDKEMARIQTAMEYIQQKQEVDRLETELSENLEEAYFARRAIRNHNVIGSKSDAKKEARAVYMDAARRVQETKHLLRRAKARANGRMVNIAAVLATATADPVLPPPPPPTLFSKCPIDMCTGIIDTSGRCVKCPAQICTTCCDVLLAEQPHACNPDTVATIEMLRADTKPCPSCMAPIHKIDGCYQMWCTKCHTTFHYRTLEILNERIHNPHFVEWNRRNSVIDLDDALYTMQARILESNMTPEQLQICNYFIPFVTHTGINAIALIMYKLQQMQDQQARRVRLAKYVQGKLSLKAFQQHLYSSYKQTQRLHDLRTLMTKLINNVLNAIGTVDDLRAHIADLMRVHNAECLKIAKTYDNSLSMTAHLENNRLWIRSRIAYL